MRQHLTFGVMAALVLGINGEAAAKKRVNPSAPVGTQQLQRLTGLWVGDVSYRVTGSPELIISGFQDCAWTANGWAIACEAAFTAPGFDYDEAILGGYDAAHNQVQWSVVNSFGQAHSMYGQFVGANKMVLVRTSDVGGQTQVDTVTYTFISEREMHFIQQVKVGDFLAAEVEATMVRVRH
ncbi:MAG TPA: hypothetical protein VFH51_01655 [Myxococcota bacterium]|nr:hypothetical protein [Myxococcota bacterium]